MTVVKLLPGETMAEYQARRRLDTEAAAVLAVVRCNPGIDSKEAIAMLTGFTVERADVVIQALNRNETTHKVRIDYGMAKPLGGPWAGRQRVGWFVQDVAAYQGVMRYADWHSAQVEAGVRRSRIDRKLYAQGCTTKTAAAVVATIDARMSVPVDRLPSAADVAEFERLAVIQAAEFIKLNGN